MPSDRSLLQALKNIISEVDLILSTTPLPQNRTARSRELLRAALALTDDLIGQVKLAPAVALGHLGGSVTSQRHGPEHFRRMAAQRKTRGGGRPPKSRS